MLSRLKFVNRCEMSSHLFAAVREKTPESAVA